MHICKRRGVARNIVPLMSWLTRHLSFVRIECRVGNGEIQRAMLRHDWPTSEQGLAHAWHLELAVTGCA